MPSPRQPAAPNRALAALGSPIRQELVSALGQGPATVTDLATRLGRTRQALYHHVAVLEAAELLRVVDWRGAGRQRERVYGLTTDRPGAGADRSNPADRGAAKRAVLAMLRLTGREFVAALEREPPPSGRRPREQLAVRGKARLSLEELRRLNQLIDQIIAVLRSAKSRPRGGRLYSATLVVTPTRDVASPTDERSST